MQCNAGLKKKTLFLDISSTGRFQNLRGEATKRTQFRSWPLLETSSPSHRHCRNSPPLPLPSRIKMLTKYLTGVRTSFSPFNARSGKVARNFLALLPPNARSTMTIDVKMLPKTQVDTPSFLDLKFSKTAFPNG